MHKVKLTEEDLRKIITEAFVQEARAISAGEITSNSLIKDLVTATSAFNAENYLKLIGALTGANINGWWSDIQAECTVKNAFDAKCTVNGTPKSYGAFDSSRAAAYAANPASFLYGFLNFIAKSLLEG